VFHAYVLHPTGVANQYTVIYDSGLLTMPALTVPTVPEVATFPVSSAVAVQAGDVIAYYGESVPFSYTTGTADTTSYPAPAAPALSSTMTLGVDPGFPIPSGHPNALLRGNHSPHGLTPTTVPGRGSGRDSGGGCCPFGAPPSSPSPTTTLRSLR
jgi:hypothetical protein